MNKWTIEPRPNPEKTKTLQEQLKISPILCNILIQRGIETFSQAKLFFRPKAENLYDPYLMKDMDKAVKRIETAIRGREYIMIYGDYDVDGISSVAMFSSFMKTIYPNITTYIPDRYSEGYGVSDKGIAFAQDNDISLIIALDCGIKAIDKVALAKEYGIDFIICDHHLPGEILPAATAILNPKQKDCNYPFKHLCGCGVGFKLVQAMAQRQQGYDFESLKCYLDLVAIAIAADIVPMYGENRTLMALGIEVLKTAPRLGLKALIPENIEDIKVSDIVFKIAPNINATGRIDHADKSVNLLTEVDKEKVKSIASSVVSINNSRKELDREATEDALKQIIDNCEKDELCSVVYNPRWHKGIVGITASRLIETYYRPTIVLTEDEHHIVGSGRSIKGFDLYRAIESCKKHLVKFGGHTHAVGLSLEKNKFEIFKTAFQDYVKANINPEILVQEIKIDARIFLSDISKKFVRVLNQFGPFGPHNMTPLFYSEGLRDCGTAKTLGKDNEHLSLMLSQDNFPYQIRSIGFGLGHKIDLLKNNTPFRAVFSIEENKWKGNNTLQIRLRDISL